MTEKVGKSEGGGKLEEILQKILDALQEKGKGGGGAEFADIAQKMKALG